MLDTTKQSLSAQSQPQLQQQVQENNEPTPTVSQYPAVQSMQQNEGWWRRNHKNNPQSNSVGVVSLILMSGGMNMAWKLGITATFNETFTITKHIILSWFIGAIVGVVIGAILCNYLPKKILMVFASILATIGGIIQVTEPNSYGSILASRYINGIAVGLVFPMTFVLLGEEVVKQIRGMNAAYIDTMCFGSGIFVETIYNVLWPISFGSDFQLMKISGALNIIFGVVAFFMSQLLIIESPVFYLTRGEEQMAIDSLRRLQKPLTITYETYEQLEEHKLYLAENKERNLIQNAAYGVPALLKLCFYRSFMALGFSYYINYAFSYASILTSNSQIFPYILYALPRMFGPIFVSFSMDSRGRKPPMIIGFVVCTILAFTAGGIFDDTQNVIDLNYMNAVKYILIFFQLFVSISMVSSSAYLSEAFPLAVKPYYVAIVFIVEMLVQIIIICSKDIYIINFVHISQFFLTLGALSLVFLFMALFVMPETKLCSLRECLPKFRQLNNFRK